MTPRPRFPPGRFLGPGLGLVLAVALVLRLVAQHQMSAAPDSFAPIIDAEAYLLQSLRVSAGKDVAEGVYFQAPLYPLLAGAALALSGVHGPSADAWYIGKAGEWGKGARGAGRARGR